MDNVSDEASWLCTTCSAEDADFFAWVFREENGHKDIRLASYSCKIRSQAEFRSVCALSADGKKVMGAATIGDPESEFAKFPAPFNTHDSIYGHFGTRVEYRKYNNKDPLSGPSVTALDPVEKCFR